MDYVDIDQGYMDAGEEAHYWFAVSDFADLSRHHGLYNMLQDVIELRRKLEERDKRNEK